MSVSAPRPFVMPFKLLSVLLAVALMSVSFCVTAFASSYDVSDLILTWFIDAVTGQYDMPVTYDDIKDYFVDGDPDGKLNTKVFEEYGLNPWAHVGAMYDIANIKAGQYAVTKLKQDHINTLTDMLNGYWSYNNADVRNNTLAQIGITFYGDRSMLNSSWGYVLGSGTFLTYEGFDDQLYFSHGQFNDGTVLYLYNGNIYHSPVLYVPKANTVYHYGNALLPGYYYVLSGNDLLYCYNHSLYADKMLIKVETSSSSDSIDLWYYRDYLNYPQLVTNGQYYYITDKVSALDKIVKSVGMHITVSDDPNDYFVAPDISNIADDDGYCYCLCRTDQPAAPIYISPTTYNTYINNGDIVNVSDDDVINNLYTTNQLNDFSTIINNYGGGGTGGGDLVLDDDFYNFFVGQFNNVTGVLGVISANVLAVLNAVDIDINLDSLLKELNLNLGDLNNNINNISDDINVNFDGLFNDIKVDINGLFDDLIINNNNKFDDLIKVINKNSDRIESAITPDKDYDKFSDCITLNVPIVRQTTDIINQLQDATSQQTDPSELLVVNAKLMDSPVTFAPSFDWYDGYRVQVRQLLEVGAYVLGLACCWRSFKSLFGVQSSNGD